MKRLTMLIFALLCTTPAFAQYRFTDVALPFPGAFGQACTGINNAGTIVGIFDDAASRTQSFMGHNNHFTLLPLLTTRSLNNQGHYTGWFFDSLLHGFVFQTVEFQILNYPDSTLTEAVGLNTRDDIVGDFRDKAGFFHAFLLSNGVFSTVDPPFAPPSWGCSNTGINDDGVMVGNCSNQAYMDNHGQFTPIMVPGSDWTFAQNINNNGDIVGNYSFGGGPSHGWISPADTGGFQDIMFPGAQFTEVFAINDRGDICGSYSNGIVDSNGGIDRHVFIASPSGGFARRFTRR